MTISFGLDFGTTNSVLSVVQDGKVEIIQLDPSSESKTTLKSVLFFDEDRNVSVGQEAIDLYLEYGGAYGRFMQSIKALLPSKTFSDTGVFGQRFDLEELISLILSSIKERGEVYARHTVDTVVLGRPVFFSEDPARDLLAEKRLRKAAELAGFSNIHFMYEPIAASLAYESTLKKGEEKLIFMGDFGGGTSDFVVMKLHGGAKNYGAERRNDVLATGGVYVAGDALDAAIMWNKVASYFGKGVTYKGMTGQNLPIPLSIVRTLCQWHLIPQLRDRSTLRAIRDIKRTADNSEVIENLENLILENFGYSVFRSIEKSKRALSLQEESVITFSHKLLSFREPITRQEFELMAHEEFQKISDCIDNTLIRAGVKPGEIDQVLLTGGTSFIPKIRGMFSQRFGEEKLLNIDAFTSVAHGLGLSALKY